MQLHQQKFRYFAVLAARLKPVGELEVVDVDHLGLHALAHFAQDLRRSAPARPPREVGGNARLLPRLFH